MKTALLSLFVFYGLATAKTICLIQVNHNQPMILLKKA